MNDYARLRAAGHTRKGIKNRENEDRAFVDPQLGLFIVADGLGGYSGGAMASSIAVNTISSMIRSHLDQATTKFSLELLISHAIEQANVAIRNTSYSTGDFRDMATTVVVAFFRGQNALIANVGDSRAYVMDEGRLRMISHDHSAVAELLDNRLLSEDQYRTHPFRNIVTRALGSAPIVQPHIYHSALVNVDLLLLCTDGLWAALPDILIEKVLKGGKDPAKKCLDLVDLAVSNGTSDDTTCVLVELR